MKWTRTDRGWIVDDNRVCGVTGDLCRTVPREGERPLSRGSCFPGLSQILPSFPFPLMIFTLVVVNSKTLRLLAARWPRVGRFLVPVPPSALGTNFATD